jgi:hypothetical protein
MGAHLLTEKVVTGFKTGDFVEAYYNGSRYTGVLGTIDEKWLFAQVKMAPGVDMILPLSTMTVIKEEEFDELDSE